METRRWGWGGSGRRALGEERGRGLPDVLNETLLCRKREFRPLILEHIPAAQCRPTRAAIVRCAPHVTTARTQTHTGAHTHVHARTHTLTGTRAHRCPHIRAHAHIGARTHARAHVRTHMQLQLRARGHSQTQTCTTDSHTRMRCDAMRCDAMRCDAMRCAGADSTHLR